MQDSSLARCDKLYRKVPTYVNDALGHSSCIDYILVSCPSNVYDFAVLDPDVNFSDHLPLKMTLLCYFSARVKKICPVGHAVEMTFVIYTYDGIRPTSSRSMHTQVVTSQGYVIN